MTYPELTDKVVLITGGSRGIGAGTPGAFPAAGARGAPVGGAGGAPDAATAGTGGIGIVADVTRQDQIEAARSRTESELGPVDVLCAFAGGGIARPGPTAA